MKVQIPYVTELHGSVEKKIFKAGTTARTYKIKDNVRWISIGKRNNRKRPYKKTQLLRTLQIKNASRFWFREPYSVKDYYRELAEKEGLTAFARYCKDVIPQDRAYIYCYDETTIIEDDPNENWYDDDTIYLYNEIGHERRGYFFVDDDYIPLDVDPSKFKLVWYIWKSSIEIEEATIQLYRIKNLNVPIQKITWNNQPDLETIPTTETTIHNIPTGEDLNIRVEMDISSDIEKFQKREIEHIYGWMIKCKETYTTPTTDIASELGRWNFHDVQHRIEIEMR